MPYGEESGKQASWDSRKELAVYCCLKIFGRRPCGIRLDVSSRRQMGQLMGRSYITSFSKNRMSCGACPVDYSICWALFKKKQYEAMHSKFGTKSWKGPCKWGALKLKIFSKLTSRWLTFEVVRLWGLENYFRGHTSCIICLEIKEAKRFFQKNF